MRHEHPVATSLRFTIAKGIGGYWSVYDHVEGCVVASWLSYGAADLKAAVLNGHLEDEDEPAYQDRDDRAASAADRNYQLDREEAT